MSQLNDAILAKTGGPTTSDGQLDFYQAGGATSNDIDDAEAQLLGAVSAGADKHVQDMWFKFLRTGGYAGALSDMKHKYWST